MKSISISLQVDAEAQTGVEESLDLPRACAAAVDESFSFALTADVEDNTPAGPIVEQMIRELLRRYTNLNARKTN